jgi:phosphonate transport system permease protein
MSDAALQGGSAAGLLRPPTPPERFARPSPLAFLASLVALAFLAIAVDGVGVSPAEFLRGFPGIGRMLGQMFPPDATRLASVGQALLVTFQMAVVGTVFGIAWALPLAILATRSQTPHPLAYYATRGVISFARSVPDLIWALVFVIAVGLGPFAGMLAIMIDTLGFCGRFFAESMEEVDRGPQEALESIGASRLGTVVCAVLPAAFPALINTALYSVEKATRASVVLGLVGAGGIGIELKVAMDMFSYDQAATIILAVFALVFAVEQASAALRRRIL